ncbi:helix-turn-helix transcriptional regulator, partial [Enterococcus faecium]|uniref:helix-turn-helix transcriptional regulator n=1 Tax=Enterococcus faecium TaxID=1352 RepID=UPI003AAF4A0F
LMLTLTLSTARAQPHVLILEDGRPSHNAGPLLEFLSDLDETLTVADLAAEAGLSPSRLHAAFRAATGQGPAACLADLRLDRAVDLLGQGRLGIAEIALARGYVEQSALTRALRRRRGITPGQLRRR